MSDLSSLPPDSTPRTRPSRRVQRGRPPVSRSSRAPRHKPQPSVLGQSPRRWPRLRAMNARWACWRTFCRLSPGSLRRALFSWCAGTPVSCAITRCRRCSSSCSCVFVWAATLIALFAGFFVALARHPGAVGPAVIGAPILFFLVFWGGGALSWLLNLVLGVVYGLRANNGEWAGYPGANQQPRHSPPVDGRRGNGDAGEARTGHATTATSAETSPWRGERARSGDVWAWRGRRSRTI